MTVFLGPDEGMRLCVLPSGAPAASRNATVYLDQAGSILATIKKYDGTSTPGAVITGSVVTTDIYGQLPLFWFPDFGSGIVPTLYIQVNGASGPLTPIGPDMNIRVTALEVGGGGGGAVASVFGRTGAVTAQAGDYGAFYQPLNANLTTVAGLTPTTGNIIQSVAGAWSSVTPANVKTSLALVKADVGLGSVSNALQLIAANNLSDLGSASTARGNLGLGGAAVLNVGTGAGTVAAGNDSRITGALQAANNLGDIALASTARANLGLGGAAVLNVGTGAGTVAAGNDSRITGALQAANNLSDLGSASTARGNLGLGGAAVLAVGTTTGTVAAGDDSRITGALQKSVATTKGDLFVTTAASTITRLPVGSDTQVLTADSTQASGVKWGAAGGAGAYSFPDSIDPPSGDSHVVPPGPVSSNIGLLLNAGFFIPVPMGPNNRTLNEIAVEITAAAPATGVLRAVLFSATGRRPNVSLIDFGTVASTATGVVAWTGLTQVMNANTLYFLAIFAQVAAAGGSLRATASNNPYVTIHTNLPVASSGWSCYAMISVSGAVTNGTAFVYNDVDPSPRVGLKFA